MSKLKTNKAILSRLKRTGTGKLIRRSAGRSHFNTKDSGNQTRSKRQEKLIQSVDMKAFNQFLPYN